MSRGHAAASGTVKARTNSTERKSAVTRRTLWFGAPGTEGTPRFARGKRDVGDGNGESHNSPTSTGANATQANKKWRRSKKDSASSGTKAKRVCKGKGKEKENVPPCDGTEPAPVSSQPAPASSG
ncbi:hypothetical protein FISHEDRAFT_59536 [Fistulina hepatica ATCC 64428]|uniref:Uncharacterized protein n=1 Tax=Fistulina hepatica ATCC 64428 TaxID=1128425 RepID=A0A0D7AC97_9AGAR|nr:hypothetical protein FISHEDRAFT_59536 [Fistulina hepatica ATCC 64428]